MTNSEKFNLLIQQAQRLVKAANVYAMSLFVPILDRFPSIKNVSVDDWDFFVTIAGVFMATRRLYNASFDETIKEHLIKVIVVELEKWDLNGLPAFEDCKSFFERTFTGLSKINNMHGSGWASADALGMWIIWNIMKREPSNKELELARRIGALTIFHFNEWWNV